MYCRELINSDPPRQVSMSIAKDTQLSVDFILERYALGWTQQQVLSAYPMLKPELVRAVFSLAALGVSSEVLAKLSKLDDMGRDGSGYYIGAYS